MNTLERKSHRRKGDSIGVFPSLKTLHISEVPRREPNLHGPAVIEQVLEYAESIGLVIDADHYYDHVTMSAYLWPHTSEELLWVVTYFNVIGYYLNDTVGSDICATASEDVDALRTIVAYKALNILIRGMAPTNPDKYDQAFLDLYEMILKHSRPEFVGRFFASLFEHWHAATVNYEADGPYQGSVEEFICTRRAAGGMVPTVLLIEYATGCFMPTWLPGLVPSLQVAVDALVDIGGLSNELFSYDKEVLHEGTTFNLVPVIQRESCSESAVWAVHQAINLVNQRYALFQQAVQDMTTEACQIADEAQREEALAFLETYIPGLWDQVAASYHWQIEANRYRCEHNPFSELRPQLMASD